MRKFLMSGLVLLACCSNPESREEGPAASQNGAAARLRECHLLSAGKTQLEIGELSGCGLACLERASCSELSSIACSDDDEESSDEEWVLSDMGQCLERCFFLGKRFSCPHDPGAAARRCDGYRDCTDGADEAECPTNTRFACANGKRVPEEYVCDGDDDCEDSSDEHGCLERSDSVTCGSGEHIARWQVCDKSSDCNDRSDESDCDYPTFTCDGDRRLLTEYVCDLFPDCDDGSDEMDCAHAVFVCGDGKQVLKTAVCDLTSDCKDGSDEEQGCAKRLCVE